MPAPMLTQRRTSRRFLVGLVSLVVLVALDGRNSTRAEPAPGGGAVEGVVQIFGIPLGAGVRDVDAAAARAGVRCVESGELSIVCPTQLAVAPVAAAETIWLKDGSAERVYVVANVGNTSSFEVHHRAFGLMSSWVSRYLGAPAVPARPPAWWASPAVDDRRKMADIVAQRARLEASWFDGDATVRLWLAGEGGQPRLVLGMWREAPTQEATNGCSPAALNDALLNLFPPASESARSAAAQRLAACHVTRAAGALGAALAHDPAPEVQAQALRALEGIGAAPNSEALEHLSAYAPSEVANVANEIASARRLVAKAKTKPEGASTFKKAPPAPAIASSNPDQKSLAPTPTPTEVAAGGEAEGPAAPPPSKHPVRRANKVALDAPRPAPDTEAVATTPAAPAPPSGPVDGTPLAIGASTVAGAVLMRNLGSMGISDVSGQLLIGSAGAVIGFGTSWGLARFGLRPTLGQAAWYANATAWGTLVGLNAWSASGSSSAKLEYGSLVLGEAAGMGLGVWSARRWNWTVEQTVLADSLLVGAGLTGFGVDRLRGVPSQTTVTTAIGTPILMVASAIAAHQMNPTANDLRLMSFGALGGAWTGGLLASGAESTGLFDSHEGQGGLLIGAGAGYLGAAVAGAFTEAPSQRLALSGAGTLSGNLLGLGLQMAITAGTTPGPGAMPVLTDGDRNRWKLGAGIGGLTLGAAAYAYQPYLRPGPSALPMTLAGTLYGGGIWWLAATAAAHGQPTTDLDTAHLEGRMLAGSVAGGLSGLIASRWFAPDPLDQLTVLGSTGAGLATGLGIARLTTDSPGMPDATGVLAGAGAGFVGGVLVDRATRLRAPDFGAAAVGAGYGAIIGALAPTLGDDTWNSGRKTVGGTWLGLGAGALGAGALAHALSADGADVAVPATAGVFGLGIGYGAGLLWTSDGTQPQRIGTVVGPLAMMGGAMLAERRLHLADGLGPSAVSMAVSGAAFGGAWGLMLAGTLDPSGRISQTPSQQIGGGMLMGASAGMASGLVLSRFFEPNAGDIAFTFTASTLGTSLGLGIPELIFDQGGRHDTLGAMVGSVSGMIGGAALSRRLTLAPPAIGAGVVGAGYGTLIGTLAPTMLDARWDGGRAAGGGALVGLSLGAIGATMAAHVTEASSAQVATVSIAGALGISGGLGAGLMLPTDSLRPARIGTVVGPLAMIGATALAEPRLHLSEVDAANARPFAALGAIDGVADGLMVAGALDSSGLIAHTPGRELFGGALLGISAESATGFLLSRRFTLDAGGAAVATSGKLFGGLLGAGTVMLVDPTAGRDETLAALGGSLAGLAGAAAAEHAEPMQAADGVAALVGGGFAGVVGALAPRLDQPSFAGFDRKTTGGTLAGLSLGVFGGAAIRRASDAPMESIGLTALGGADGLATGLGVGMIARDGEADRPLRIGMITGTAAGLAIGAGIWPRITLGPGDRGLIGAGTAVGGWTALWLPVLGHATSETVDGAKMKGALLAGAGLSSFVTSFMTPRLELDDDLLENAIAMDLLFTGAGAGAGALASPRTDASAWGLLAGGTAGLLLGGALHRSIELDGSAPLLTLSSGEGLWFGGWLPYLLHEPSDVTRVEVAEGLATGALGSAGLATLASGRLHISPAAAGYSALGSAVGASIAGGTAMLDDNLGSRASVGLMLGGTGLGLVGGLLASPHLESNGLTPAGAGALGGTLGASEALLFAWSGGATTGSQYGGAALIGGGLGTMLGIASESSPYVTGGGAPASAGFAAWGAWTGSFAGSLFKVDAHEIALGGLAGANVGFLTGYGLQKLEVVEARDFGWLSLFGGLGTIAGAGVGAPFSTPSNRTPILAGLAIGPTVGMLAGGLALPRLRKVAHGSPSAAAAPTGSSGRMVSIRSVPERTFRGFEFERRPSLPGFAPEIERAPAPVITSDEVLRAPKGFWSRHDFARSLKQVAEVTDWSPMLGALPASTPANPTAPTPMLIGVTGLWK